MRIDLLVTLIAVVTFAGMRGDVHSVHEGDAEASVETASGVRVLLRVDGDFEITTSEPSWTFSGRLERAPTRVEVARGEDRVGQYHEITFEYPTPDARRGAIRAYEPAPMVLFSTTSITEAANGTPLMKLRNYPSLPYRLSYRSEPFSPYQFNTFDAAADSPWVFFDAAANSFMLSAADNFMSARTQQLADGTIASGITSEVARLPAGFTHGTLLVVGTSLNSVFETWGAALTSLHAKHRVPNDADVTLEKLGYWTDAGAAYYYRREASLSYVDTLHAAVADVQRHGVQLGYVQLDSWFYPKGADARWDDNAGGVFEYRADQNLFPDGLPAFRAAVGLPLVVHARWIDAASPYRARYAMSGNVAIDRRYWDETMAYLRAAGVVTYEQDWLGAHAQPSSTSLTEPEAFMTRTAHSAADYGLTLQYCMALPRHFLQGTRYDGLTTMRVSDDRFERSRWDRFLYGSRLATALGAWPWSDVFFSAETHNLLLSTLSGGIVGIGDPIGAVDGDNLKRAVRADGVIVKPDSGLVPTDAMYVAEAQTPGGVMVATAGTDHHGLRAVYAVAYARGSGGAQTVSLTAADVELPDRSYVYEPLTGSGRLVDAGERIFTEPVNALAYAMVVPLGPSGIGFVGDYGLFVPLGRKRISELVDDGTLHAVVEFAAGEGPVTLGGYAPDLPSLSSPDGTIDAVAFDPTSGRFSFTLAPIVGRQRATISMTLAQ